MIIIFSSLFQTMVRKYKNKIDLNACRDSDVVLSFLLRIKFSLLKFIKFFLLENYLIEEVTLITEKARSILILLRIS